MNTESISVKMGAGDFLSPDVPVLMDADLMSTAWHAAEALASPDLSARRAGLDRLVEMKAVHSSPLVAYLLATRIIEPDLELRAQVVRILAGACTPNGNGKLANETVSQFICTYLSQMRTRQIFALLQVADFDDSVAAHAATLLKECSYAGGRLADILMDRQLPIGVRKRAAQFIGQIGYLDAMPALERMAARLEVRFPPQQTLPGMLLGEDEEAVLFQQIQIALRELRAP